MCLLVVLFAMLVMLGVPKDHKGRHGDHRLVGLQKSLWCKRPPKNVGPDQIYQTLRRSHHKSNKCTHNLHSKYKKCHPKHNDSSQLWPVVLVHLSGCSSILTVLCFVVEGNFWSYCTLYIVGFGAKTSLWSWLPSLLCQYVICWMCWSYEGCKRGERKDGASFMDRCHRSLWILSFYPFSFSLKPQNGTESEIQKGLMLHETLKLFGQPCFDPSN